MSTTSQGSGETGASGRAGITSWLLLVFLVAVNLGFCFAILHVFRTPAYRRAGRLPDLLLSGLVLNLLAGGVAALFGLSFRWRSRLNVVLAGQCLISLLSFALVRALRIPGPDFRLHVLGTIYASIIYLHFGMLVIHGFSNVLEKPTVPRTSKLVLPIWIFTVSLLLYGSITPWTDAACLPTADEPHYLLLTHSLVFDHDFDIENNYANRDYKSFYPPEIPRPDHHTVTNARGQEVPVHDVGVSILLVPGYALAGRLGAMLEMNIFGAALALGIFVLGTRWGASSPAALAAWALFAFTSPVVVYTSQIYPEIVGAAITVWALVTCINFIQTRRGHYLLVTSSALAFLPWLSVRYWVILGPMLAVMALYLMVAGGSPRGDTAKQLGLMFLPLLASLGIFAAFDLHWYQTPIPNAGYVLLLRPRPSLLTPHLLPGLPGLLFDRGFGLLTTAPVYLLAIAGAWVLCRWKPWQGALVALPVLAYLLLAALNRFWWGGWAPPPRYIVSGVAIMAPLAALVLSQRTPRLLLTVLAGWSVFIAVAYTAFPLTRYTYWKVNSGALSDFLAGTLKFHFGTVFPSFIRASLWDYLLCSAWGALGMGAIWMLVRTAPTHQEEIISVPAHGTDGFQLRESLSKSCPH